MKLLLAALVLSVHGSLAAETTRQPVLIELFTSQGCSSCPPADELLRQLDLEQPEPDLEIIPLAFHVDYWDYIGWKDPFASKAWTQRQYAYARALKSTQVYTPQAIVNGREGLVGHQRGELLALAKERPAERLDLELKGDKISVKGLDPALGVQLAWAEDALLTEVKRGENKGRALRSQAVVKKYWEQSAGATELEIGMQDAGSASRLVVFQSESNPGPVTRAGQYLLKKR